MAEPNRRRHAWRCIVASGALVLAAFTSACGGGLTQPSAFPTAAPTPPPPPRVAIISIDGLRPDALTAENTPQILALAQRGSYTLTAQTVFPSTTLPSHTSMLTGVEPSAHGITFDVYRDTFQLTTPTALSLAHVAGKRTVMVVGKEKFKQLVVVGGVDSYLCTTRGDADVVNEAIVRLSTGFDLLFVHLPQMDQTGHARGWMSAEYLAQLRQTDEAVGRLVAQLPPETTLIVTADHGGQLKNHGSKDRIDMTIPWIVTGPRVVKRGALSGAVRTVDTAVTALGLLGIPAPPNAAGKFVSEPFVAQ